MKASSNREIARNRDKGWVGKMIRGKYEHAERPSKLRQARVGSKKSQEDTADAVELSHTTYGDIERGKRPARKELAERLAHLFKRTVGELFEKHGKKFIAKR